MPTVLHLPEMHNCAIAEMFNSILALFYESTVYALLESLMKAKMHLQDFYFVARFWQILLQLVIFCLLIQDNCYNLLTVVKNLDCSSWRHHKLAEDRYVILTDGVLSRCQILGCFKPCCQNIIGIKYFVVWYFLSCWLDCKLNWSWVLEGL